MSDSTTPVCDLIERLVSRGMSTGDAVAEARPVEAAMATRRGSTPEQRERWRLKKERQRAAKAGSPRGDKVVTVESSSSPKTQTELKKERKKDSSDFLSPGDSDGWPEDYETQFWANFPKQRRGDRPQVFKLLAKLRKDKTVTWKELFAGVLRYAASDDVARGFAKAPLPWLRGHRWEIDNGGGSNGQRAGGERPVGGGSATAAAAARRFGGGARNGGAPGPAGPAQPAGGVGGDGR